TDDFQMPGVPDMRDPYPGLMAAALEHPVQHLGAMQLYAMPGEHDVYLVYRHEQVVEVLRDEARFSTSPQADIVGPVMGRTMLEMTGEEHKRYRGLVAQAFRPKVLERWKTELIEPAVHGLIDGFADRGSADLVAELNFHYPARVIARILGLPDDDLPRFHHWAVSIISYAARKQAGLAAAAELREYLAPFVAARRADPQDDLISQLVTADLDGDHLTDEELYPFLLLLLPAGVETTYRALGNLQLGLLSSPSQLAAVRADRALVAAAVEEALRWEPPIPMLTRASTCPTTLGGAEIVEDALVTVCPGTANRDPDVWPDGEVYDLERPRRQHLTFGFGAHMCLGAHLARLEMVTALEALLDRLPGLRLDPDAEDVHVHGMAFRSPLSVPVVWDAA
ncbi:MAG: cytochrome P450, partial [Nitriliruptorales bacterium]|nr:cytochrome P450 [Nitriliruptorales bacterium]